MSRARHSDPSSSHEAVAAMAPGILNHQQSRAAAAVRANPGRTSSELATECGLDRYELARRLPECDREGRVRRGPIRKDSYTNRSGVTWWPV